MTPRSLAGLIGVTVAGLAAPAQALDKADCVAAHETAQELRQRDSLAQAREHLLICSDARCPHLVVEECQLLLAGIDRQLQAAGSERAAPATEQVQDAPREDCPPCASADSGAVWTPLRSKGVPPPPGTCCTSAPPSTRSAQRVPPAAPLVSVRDPPGGRPGRGPSPGRPGLTALIPGALAVAALGSAAYFGWRGLANADELKRTCAPDCDASQVSPIRRQLLIADFSLMAGVGLGALTAWTVWNARARETSAPEVSNRRQSEKAPGAGWSVVPGVHSLQVAYGGGF